MRGATEAVGATDGWSVIAGAAAGIDPEAIRSWAGRLADLASPALAAHLLAPLDRHASKPLVPWEREQKARLYNRLVRHSQLHWLGALGAAGIRPVCLKGFAAAHRLYADAVARAIGDLDLLVHREDVPRAVRLLAAEGFRIERPRISPFGFISEASFLPLVSPDGTCVVDIHLEPDCYPAHRGLDAEALRARAVAFEAGGTTLLAPSDEHHLLLLATNAAKDKFGPEALRKVIDGLVLLRRRPLLDWDEVARIARKGGFARPLGAFLSLLSALGAPAEAIPPALVRRPGWPARGELMRIVAEHRALFPRAAGLWGKLRREALIGVEPRTLLHNNLKRLRGLVTPAGGVPPGWPSSARRP
jgi:hypothetical protein